jgi:hypothetical protein
MNLDALQLLISYSMTTEERSENIILFPNRLMVLIFPRCLIHIPQPEESIVLVTLKAATINRGKSPRSNRMIRINSTAQTRMQEHGIEPAPADAFF